MNYPQLNGVQQILGQQSSFTIVLAGNNFLGKHKNAVFDPHETPPQAKTHSQTIDSSLSIEESEDFRVESGEKRLSDSITIPLIAPIGAVRLCSASRDCHEGRQIDWSGGCSAAPGGSGYAGGSFAVPIDGGD